MIQQDQSPPTILVLAAGQGARFKASGGCTDKLDAPLLGQSVRTHVLDAVRASGLPHHVVERHHLTGIQDAGMGDSIACGVAATPHANGWLVLPADLPLIQPTTLLAVAHALRSHAIVIPFFNHERGHPVGFQVSFRDELKKLTGDVGARKIVSQHAFHALDVNDQGAVLDVDTVALLDEARRLLQHRHFIG